MTGEKAFIWKKLCPSGPACEHRHAHTKSHAQGLSDWGSHTHRAGNRLTSRVRGLEKRRKKLLPECIPLFDWIKAHQYSVQVLWRTEGRGGPCRVNSPYGARSLPVVRHLTHRMHVALSTNWEVHQRIDIHGIISADRYAPLMFQGSFSERLRSYCRVMSLFL